MLELITRWFEVSSLIMLVLSLWSAHTLLHLSTTVALKPVHEILHLMHIYTGLNIASINNVLILYVLVQLLLSRHNMVTPATHKCNHFTLHYVLPT